LNQNRLRDIISAMAQRKPITRKCSYYRCTSKRFFADVLRLLKLLKKVSYLGWLKAVIAYHKTHLDAVLLGLLPQLWVWKTNTISITDKDGVIFTQPIITRAKSVISSFIFNLVSTSRKKFPGQNKTARYGREISSELREIFGINAVQDALQNTVQKVAPQISKPLSKIKHFFSALKAKQLSKISKVRTAIRKRLPGYVPYVLASLLLATGILSICYGTYIYVFKDLPEAKELVQNEQIITTRILDRNGNLLFRIYEDENRTLVTLSQIPQHTVQATIAIEDQDFYEHHGFSVKAIMRALVANSQGKPVQGGSTITQQLVKNRLLTAERTLRRKIREVLLAIVVDGTFTKDEILEMYLNQVAYGGATYGIEEAAQTYFGKPATQLTLAESAMLAGLPAAPSAYNPFGSNPELAYVRQKEVLRRMVVEEFITEEQAAAAQDEDLAFRSNTIDIKAPHFVMYVRELLAKQYGEDILNQGGLEVRTTLDLKLQDATQEIVTKEVTSLEKLRVSNGAALVTNPTTGEILAMIGSKNYFDFENDGQVNVTIRERQPGSSIKPLTYAVALEKGKTPQTIIEDTPVVYNIPGSPPYAPKNYDGKYHGRVTLRQALASSYNIPAVKLLAEVGINTVLNKAEAIGISTWGERNRFGLSLTLGGGEVLMTELSELYGTFANDGYTEPLNPILEVTNSKGETLYRNGCALDKKGCVKKRNFDPRVTYQITDILKDNAARTPAFGPQSVLTIPNQDVAVKTGTTNNLRDNWTIGYTSDILVAVWVGNNDNTSMSYVASGITGASPIWNEVIRLTLDDENPHRFSVPDGLVKVEICERTGTLTCSACPKTVDAYYFPGTEPTQSCNGWNFRPQPSPDPQSQGQIL
jgi:1A family penicillin-binding protein